MARPAIDQPIGFWLRRADRLLSDHVDGVLRSEGLSRLHWQLLVSLAAGPPLAGAVHGRPRDQVDPATLQGLAADLVRRGWLDAADAARARLRLSDSGRAARTRIAALIDAVRARSLQGISEADYALTLRTLQRLCANLEAGE